MIGPVSILSLAAVSAAESTSSGKRGLREPVQWMWPAIVLTSAGVVGLGAGILIGYLIKGGGSSGGLKPGKSSAGSYRTSVSGCALNKLQSTAMPTDGVTAPDCGWDCFSGTTTDGFQDFKATAEADANTAKKACTKCEKDFIPTAENECKRCKVETMAGTGDVLYQKAKSLHDVMKAGSTFKTQADCISACGNGIGKSEACDSPTAASTAAPKVCGVGLEPSKRNIVEKAGQKCDHTTGTVTKA